MRSELANVAGNVALLAGIVGVGMVAVAAAVGPFVSPYDPQAQHLVVFFPTGDWAIPPTPPSRWYLLGTDPIGRDILSRLLWGARLTFVATTLAVLGRTLVGVALGFAAGWLRGIADAAVRNATDALAGFPQLMLAIFLVVLLGDLGLVGFVIALAAVGWPELTQFVRGEVIRVRAAPYVEASRAIGATTPRIVVQHIARNLAPQLVGLVALEAGSVLILLAELGFIGLFVAGGVFSVDDAGRPVLPVRERAPEWGQMLAGARRYAYIQQWVAFVPAVVVGTAVFAFNLLGEGVREALDPFSPRRLHPRTLSALGRGALAFALAGAVVFAGLTVRQRTLTFEAGLDAARAAAERELPGGALLGAVVRYRSDAHALSRPEKLNYYFERDGELLRVGFVDAEPDAMEVLHYDHEDAEIDPDVLVPVAAWSLRSTDALAAAERAVGLDFRNNTVQYGVRLILAQREGWSGPVWRVQYSRPTSAQPAIDLPLDARSGVPSVPLDLYAADAEREARRVLGEPAFLAVVSASWAAQRSGALVAVELPGQITYDFTAERAPLQRNASVTYNFTQPASPFVRPLGPGLLHLSDGTPLERAERLPLGDRDLLVARRLVEDAGGAAAGAEAAASGNTAPHLEISIYGRDGHAIARASYSFFAIGPGGRASNVISAGFEADLSTGAVTRLR